MKVNFCITGNDNEDYDELSIDWALPFLPRTGEAIFLDELFKGKVPKKILNCMFHIDSVDWRYDKELKCLLPKIWVQDIENVWKK